MKQQAEENKERNREEKGKRKRERGKGRTTGGKNEYGEEREKNENSFFCVDQQKNE